MTDRIHPFEFPDYVIERVMAKRGRLRVFDSFDPAKTALVTIDMQNFYVAEVATARAIVPNINRVASAMRDLGSTIVWLCMTAGDAGKSDWPIYHDYFFSEAKGAKHRDQLTEGADGHELWHELDAREDDLYVYKNRFSPFVGDASDLHEQLQARGIENLVICGTATNFCCETTARDAMMLDYRVVMVSDGCAARYDEDHLVGLTSVYQSFGDVMSAEQVVGELFAEGSVEERTQVPVAQDRE